MPTANEKIQDAVIRHQVALHRYEAGEVRKIIALLDATQADLEAQLARRLLAIADGRPRSALVTERLQKLLDNIRSMRLAAYREAGKTLTADLVDFGRYEAEFGARMIQAASPVELAMGTTAVIEQVSSIVRSQPFQGLILRDWVADLAAKELAGVKRAINVGMAEGEGIPEIVRRIVGSPRNGVKGVLDISRRNATTWVRTAVSHTANETRDAFYQANADLVKGVSVVVTLDSRTCPICIPRDGKVYSLPDHKPVGHSIPWGAGPGRYHPQDRCTSTPVLKSWKEMGIDLKEAPEGTRASMDGQVPAGMSYQDWLKRQPAAVQDDVLGVTRARSMRKGELRWDNLFTAKGEFRGIRELSAAEASAGRIADFPTGPRTFYHVVGQNYEKGQPLRSWNQILADGDDPGPWKWPEADVGQDADVVSMYTSMQEAVEHIDEFGGARVVRIQVPDDALIVKNVEGFNSIQGKVPSEWLKDHYDGRTMKPLLYEYRDDLVAKKYTWSPEDGWLKPGVAPRVRKKVPTPSKAAAQTGLPKPAQVTASAPSIAGASVKKVDYPPGAFWRVEDGDKWATFDAAGNLVKAGSGRLAPSDSQVVEWASKIAV